MNKLMATIDGLCFLVFASCICIGEDSTPSNGSTSSPQASSGQASPEQAQSSGSTPSIELPRPPGSPGQAGQTSSSPQAAKRSQKGCSYAR